jgi:hypothetical protein
MTGQLNIHAIFVVALPSGGALVSTVSFHRFPDKGSVTQTHKSRLILIMETGVLVTQLQDKGIIRLQHVII